LAQPYAAAERNLRWLGDDATAPAGEPYGEDKFASTWTPTTPAAEIAGLGAVFALKSTSPARKSCSSGILITEEATEQSRLPYLDELCSSLVGMRCPDNSIPGGDTDIISRFSAENYSLLSKRKTASRRNELFDLGPSLEYQLSRLQSQRLSSKNLSKIAAKQAWFQDLKFRLAVSSAIDREGIVKLVIRVRAVPLWGNVSPSNKAWVEPRCSPSTFSLTRRANS